MQIILHLEATLHKLTPAPSKAKNTALARAGLILVCLFLVTATPLSADIVIDSGAQKDTVIHVKPRPQDESDPGGLVMESDPGNGSVLLTAPPRSPQEDDGTPVIVVPEIHIKE
jgi:hypothetical protein